MAIGGDGAPFGKWDQAMSWQISFLNVGPRVASPNDNFLLFGANCKEDHKGIVRLTEKLASDKEAIEKKTYTVMGKEVTFSFDLLPQDMKFLAFVNGEFTNSEKHFSSFANVSQDDSVGLKRDAHRQVLSQSLLVKSSIGTCATKVSFYYFLVSSFSSNRFTFLSSVSFVLFLQC